MSGAVFTLQAKTTTQVFNQLFFIVKCQNWIVMIVKNIKLSW